MKSFPFVEISTSALVLTLVGALLLFVQDGFTPLHMACIRGYEEIAEMLKEEGTDLEVRAKVS